MSTHTSRSNHLEAAPCANQCEGCGCSADTEAKGQTKAVRAARRPIKHILVAVDHDHHNALETALALAGPLHAEIAIIHVFDPASIVNSESAQLYAQMADQLRAGAKSLLKDIEQELPESSRAFTCLREGTVSQEILSAAQEWNADLIVMGTHRRGVISRALLGSASQGVLRHGRCPVLLVDDTPVAAAKPVEQHV